MHYLKVELNKISWIGFEEADSIYQRCRNELTNPEAWVKRLDFIRENEIIISANDAQIKMMIVTPPPVTTKLDQVAQYARTQVHSAEELNLLIRKLTEKGWS